MKSYQRLSGKFKMSFRTKMFFELKRMDIAMSFSDYVDSLNTAVEKYKAKKKFSILN